MLARRIRRDVKERGRDVDGILDQYLRFVKSSYDNFVQPSSRHADIVRLSTSSCFSSAHLLDLCQGEEDNYNGTNAQIVPGSSNNLAIDLLVSHVKRQLDSRSLRFRKLLANMEDQEPMTTRQHRLSQGQESENVYLLEQTNQLKVGLPLSLASWSMAMGGVQRAACLKRQQCRADQAGYNDDTKRPRDIARRFHLLRRPPVDAGSGKGVELYSVSAERGPYTSRDQSWRYGSC